MSLALALGQQEQEQGHGQEGEQQQGKQPREGGEQQQRQRRCALYHELASNHDDVMAGLAWAFQAASCDVDIFQKADSYGIRVGAQACGCSGLVLYLRRRLRTPGVAFIGVPSAHMFHRVSARAGHFETRP